MCSWDGATEQCCDYWYVQEYCRFARKIIVRIFLYFNRGFSYTKIWSVILVRLNVLLKIKITFFAKVYMYCEFAFLLEPFLPNVFDFNNLMVGYIARVLFKKEIALFLKIFTIRYNIVNSAENTTPICWLEVVGFFWLFFLVGQETWDKRRSI